MNETYLLQLALGAGGSAKNWAFPTAHAFDADSATVACETQFSPSTVTMPAAPGQSEVFRSPSGPDANTSLQQHVPTVYSMLAHSLPFRHMSEKRVLPSCADADTALHLCMPHSPKTDSSRPSRHIPQMNVLPSGEDVDAGLQQHVPHSLKIDSPRLSRQMSEMFMPRDQLDQATFEVLS